MSKQPPQQSDPDSLVEAYEQLQSKMSHNNYDLVDQIGQICQSVMWGDKNNDTFFDYFCDQKTMSLYLDLVHTGQREVVVAVIKAITMLLQNIQRPVSINYILSHSALNGIIIAEYNFRDDEIIAYYINLLKCVSIRIDEQSLQLFYNLKFSTFPMLMKAICFYKHKENLIRTSVRNIVLGITKINLPQLRRYVSSFPFTLFYVQFSCYMRDALFYIGSLIQEGRQESHKIIKLLLDDQLDILYFLEDLLKTNVDALPIIVNSIMVYGFVPTIIMGVIKSGQQSIKFNQQPQRQSMNHQQSQKYQHNRGQSLGNFTFSNIFSSSQQTNNQQQQQVIDIKFCLFILIQIYKSFSFSQFLDLLTLFILGKDPEIVDFITQLNSNSKLNSYEKDVSMSETWVIKEKTFIQAYSQFIYKDCEIGEDINVNDKEDLLKGVSSYETQSVKRELSCEHFKPLICDPKRYEDLLSITDMCDITIVKSQNKSKASALSFLEKQVQNKVNGNTNTNNTKTPFYALMKHLESNDDTVVFMVLLFIKTLRHSKNISHSVLEQVGLITPDKNMELYKNCLETSIFMQDKLLGILEIGLPPYRLGTYILSIQMLIDFCRTDLESYDLHYKDRFRNIVLAHINKINEYINNPLEVYYVIEFFYTEYKILKQCSKTSISIWPQTHIQLLYEMTPKGVCQIDIKHNESVYFMEPGNQQDKVRKDMLIMLILKYTASVLSGFEEQEQRVLDNPKPFGDGPTLKYVSGNVYNLQEEPYCKFSQHQCKYQNIDCCILEDSHNLVVLDLTQGQSAAKCIVVHSLKYTDEMVERLNLKMLHVTYRFENQNNVFDLEFPNKQCCQAAKKMTEQKKTSTHKNNELQQMIIVKQNDDLTIISQENVILLKSADELTLEAKFKFLNGSIQRINQQCFLFNHRYLMELNDKTIEYQQEVQSASIQNGKSLIITNNNTVQFYKTKKLQWECKFADLIPIDYIDTCALSRSIILHVHSSIIFLSEDKQIQEIIQLEQEVHSIYALNDFNVIGVFSIANDQFSIFNSKLVQNYEFFSQQCIQFDVSISFQPYRLNCFQDQSTLHFVLIRNLEHVKHYYKSIQCVDIVSINKCRNRLLIVTKQQVLSIFISEIENTTSEEQYLNGLQLRLMNYCSSIFEGQYYFSNDSYLFSFCNDEVKYYKLVQNQKNQITKIKFQEKILFYEYVNNQLVIYSQQQSKCYLTVYNQQFEIINRYEFNKQHEGIKYCPYYAGIAIYEQKVQYQDKEPNNNYILQTETLQKTFLQLIDFRTQTYHNNNQNNNEQPAIQSYLLYGKSKNKISCGFMLDYSIVNIQNIWNNRFIITSTYKLKIIEIYNSTYEMQHIFEFSILNQQLLTFRNSLPLEDLERINFLKQSDQRILFTHFGQSIPGESKMNGIIHSFYGIKWVSINKDNVNIIQLQQKQEIQRIQRVLQEGSNYFYVLSNDEEIYKITPDEVKLIYVSGSKLLSYVSNHNNESIILKCNNELLVTELENAQKIKYNLIL